MKATDAAPQAEQSSDAPPDIRPPRAIPWRRAKLHDTRMETRTARTLVFDVPGWTGHRAGQHVDIKLTAGDGYTAQRSYSIASASAPGRLEVTVQAISEGEVSPYLVETMAPGDELELRGPIGGWFQWTEQLTEPVLLVGGGSGIVPLMAMLRERTRVDSIAPFRLLYVARTPDHIFYANELYSIGQSHGDVVIDHLYSRAGLPDDHRAPGRLRLEDVPLPTFGETGSTRVYVCGPSGFVEGATQLLQDGGHQPSAIRTERFGPTGG
jgi:ferredoxin-NADP reductase